MIFRRCDRHDMAAGGGKALALLQDVLFDIDGDYFIAAPLDSKDESALALERLALALEAVWLIGLTSATNGEQAKAKLKNRNSRFSSCNEFRVYQVESGAWAHILELIGAPEPLIKAARGKRIDQQPQPLLVEQRRHDSEDAEIEGSNAQEAYNEAQFALSDRLAVFAQRR